MVLERDDSRLDDIDGEVGHGLRDAVLKLSECVSHLRQQLPGDDETDVLIDDGLNEDLESLNEFILAMSENVIEDSAILLSEVSVGS